MEGFEYTKTPSGKVKANLHTDIERHGIIPRIIYYLFDYIEEYKQLNPSLSFSIKCSCVITVFPLDSHQNH